MQDHKTPAARSHLLNLEKKFSDLTGKYAVVGSSAPATNLFALRAWAHEHKIAEDAEVIVSGLTATSTVLDILRAGLTPAFADVDADTLQLTLKGINQAKSMATAAVF